MIVGLDYLCLITLEQFRRTRPKLVVEGEGNGKGVHPVSIRLMSGGGVVSSPAECGRSRSSLLTANFSPAAYNASSWLSRNSLVRCNLGWGWIRYSIKWAISSRWFSCRAFFIFTTMSCPRFTSKPPKFIAQIGNSQPNVECKITLKMKTLKTMIKDAKPKKYTRDDEWWITLKWAWPGSRDLLFNFWDLSLIHIWRCRRSTLCRSRWSPYH